MATSHAESKDYGRKTQESGKKNLVQLLPQQCKVIQQGSARIKHTLSQAHVPGRLLCNFTVDKMIATKITFQNSKIISLSIINHCAMFWCPINLQTHGSIVKLNLLTLLCMLANTPVFNGMSKHAWKFEKWALIQTSGNMLLL